MNFVFNAISFSSNQWAGNDTDESNTDDVVYVNSPISARKLNVDLYP